LKRNTETSSKFFLHATNVHQGGGKVLLHSILMALSDRFKTYVNLDSRMKIPAFNQEKIIIRRIMPTFFSRFWAEWQLARNVQDGDVVLCFGNLPPLFKLSGHVYVFVQNRYLVENISLSNFSYKTRLRLIIERLWFSILISYADAFIVQTPSMQKLMEVKIKRRKPVHVLPFVPNLTKYLRKIQVDVTRINSQMEFGYVASGEPHKNHRKLIMAWCLLAKEGLYPSLRLTLDKQNFPKLCKWVEEKTRLFRLKIINDGSISHDAIVHIYKKIDAMIYPSEFESLGLPLIEARQAGLPILAAELDFVRDVIDPEETFDPRSEISIARSVKRFMLKDEEILPFKTPKDFLNTILKGLS
jgi:glycosyltransferase involved in cell wall biosynthesis